MAPCQLFVPQIASEQTLLVHAKTRAKAGVHTTVESQSDRDYASGATHSHGVGDGLLLINQQSPYLTEHIKRFGQYVLDMDTPPEPLQPKPLFGVKPS